MSYSEFPWGQESTMSSDFHSIRYITDANSRVIAEVRYAEDAPQEENLANAKLIAKAPLILKALEQAHEALRCGDPNARMNALRDCEAVILSAGGEV
jgi:isocitrate dehydrogenase kinase/phosphatase